MKRFLIAGLSVVMMSAFAAPAVATETRMEQNMSANSAANTSKPGIQLSPQALVFGAYRGGFSNQGIPSYSALLDAHATGRVTASDLVKAAINANKLPPSTLSNRQYLQAVNFKLMGLNN